MNAYVTKEELTLLRANRVSHPEHHADARRKPHGVLRGLLNTIAGYFERQRVMAELGELSDRELADIGLTRPELPMVFKPGATARH